MLLDQLFGKPDKIEIYIDIKNGNFKNCTRRVPTTIEHDQTDKPLFPVKNKN